MLKEITDLKNANEIKKIYIDSFPKEERVLFEDFFSKNYIGYKLFSLIEDEQIIAMVHFKEVDEVLLLIFFIRILFTLCCYG